MFESSDMGTSGDVHNMHMRQEELQRCTNGRHPQHMGVH